jgi:hypothetical protein
MMLHTLALTLQLKLWLVMSATLIQVLRAQVALLAERKEINP